MRHRPPFAAALLALAMLCPLLAWSAEPAAEPAAAAKRNPEPAVQRTVLEDDNVRIEELKVRGQTQRISVQSKAGGASNRYEIITGDGGRDPSQDRRATGQRVWQLFSF